MNFCKLWLLDKSCFIDCGHDIILYADDIILIAPSVTELEKILHMCENELRYTDMSINKKSRSMRIGPRCNAKCANIVSLSGQCISWVTELRYRYLSHLFQNIYMLN